MLFPTNTAVGDALAKHFNLSDDELLKMWKGFYQDYMVGALTTEEFLETFAQTYGLPRSAVSREIFVDSFEQSLIPMPGINNIMHKLSAAGLKMAMLSDTTEMFADARKSSAFSHRFDHIFLSYEIGYKKPDPRAFQTVTDFYNINPKTVFFIDDDPTNVSATKTFGMDGTVFENSDGLGQTLNEVGVLR